MGAVATFVALIVLLAIGSQVVRKAKGHTSNPVYLPALGMTLLGGLFTYGPRGMSGGFEPSAWLIVTNVAFLFGAIGIYSTASPSWLGTVLDDVMHVTGLSLIIIVTLYWATESRLPENTFVDGLLWIIVTITARVMTRFATARQINFPDEARVMRIFAIFLIIMQGSMFFAALSRSDIIFGIAQFITIITAALLGYYLVLRVRTHDYRQYQIPPMPRPTFGQYILVTIAAVFGAAAFILEPLSRDSLAIGLALSCVVTTVVRQAVTLIEYERVSDATARTENHYRTMVDSSTDVIALANQHSFEVTFLSRAAERTLGIDHNTTKKYSLATLLGVPPETLQTASDKLHAGSEIELIESKVHGNTLETVLCLQNDSLRATMRDTSERDQLRQELHTLAFVDQLTGLANRTHIANLLETAYQQNPEQTHTLFIDLDRFKYINDTGGHALGDEVLRIIAERLQLCVGATGELGRVGGDEFLVVVEAGAEQVRTLARDIRKTLSAPVLVAGKSYQLGGSVGISSGAQAASAGEMIRQADIAMYHAKSTNSRYVWFDAALFDHTMQDASTEHAALSALAEKRFVLFLQPIVQVATGSVSHCEALLRWVDQQGTIQPPYPLIKQAELAGKMHVVTDWVIEECLRELAIRRAKNQEVPQLNVNIPPMKLLDPHLVDWLGGLLSHYQVPAELLSLEITEGDVLTLTDDTVTALHQLRELGVGIFVDDFGVGYSALSYLLKLPITGCKIDRRLISDLPNRSAAQTFLAEMVEVGRQHGFVVVAEGVETYAEHQQLAAAECVVAQGFLYGKPTHVAADLDGTSLASWPDHAGRDAINWSRPSSAPSPEATC